MKAVGALGAFALSGCYSYVPTPTAPPAGTEVRLRVPVTSSVGSTRGDTETMTFDGTLVSNGGDTLLLETRSQLLLGAHQQLVQLDTIRVLNDEFESLEQRVLSKPRTVAFTAALVAGGFLLVAAIDGLAGSDGDDSKGGGNGNNQGMIVTGIPGTGVRSFGFRIPIPWPSG